MTNKKSCHGIKIKTARKSHLCNINSEHLIIQEFQNQNVMIRNLMHLPLSHQVIIFTVNSQQGACNLVHYCKEKIICLNVQIL